MLSQLTFNTEQIGQATTDSIIVVVRSSLTIIGYDRRSAVHERAADAASRSPWARGGWLVSIINRHFRRYGRRIQDSMVDVTRVAKEGFEAPRLIKVYNAEAQVERASSRR